MNTRLGWLVTMLLTLTMTALVACGGGSSKGDGDLAKAVVQIFAIDSFGDTAWSGSGTLISADGLILSNAHVVDRYYDEDPAVEELRVAVTSRTDEPPEVAYLAEIVAMDSALDLAVIQVVSNLDGDPVTKEFPFVALGDSDEVEIGDQLRILGYSGVGGETITLTNGVISGFTAERGLGGRAWIKTDAGILAGNSGGLAADEHGKLIAVPTIVGSSAESEEVVDCDLVADTNRDGLIDELDACVPTGGFINGLRPVGLALALIEAAEGGTEYVSQFEPPQEAPGDFDIGDVLVSEPAFSVGVTPDDAPTEILSAIPSGSEEVCAFWDYDGMLDGLTWDARWFIDGELSEEGSFIDETWDGGEDGIDWWVCAVGDEQGLVDGVYELVISVEGEYVGSGSIFVGDDHPPVQLTVDNASQRSICGVYIAPPVAQNWGFNKLTVDEQIDVGQTLALELAAGVYDIAVDDCDEQPIVEEYELDFTQDSVYGVTDQ